MSVKYIYVYNFNFNILYAVVHFTNTVFLVRTVLLLFNYIYIYCPCIISVL